LNLQQEQAFQLLVLQVLAFQQLQEQVLELALL
jgi:hypothetical protein